jgi:DNA-binding response OmpR family regulator
MTAEAGPILVVDDDPKTVRLVCTYLEREGFRVITAGDGRTAVEATREREPSLIVLDVMLPELDGVAVTRIIRQRSDVPVLMLSARGAVDDRVFGIGEGADDYLAKPFSPAELVVRVKALLRRAEAGPRRADRGVLRQADLSIDLDRHEVRRGDEVIPVTPAEFRLLAALVAADGHVLSRETLLDHLYGDGSADALDRTIDVYIRRLRDKLGDDPDDPRYVATVRGAGYRSAPAAP